MVTIYHLWSCHAKSCKKNKIDFVDLFKKVAQYHEGKMVIKNLGQN
jgi:hypothetical protein